MFKFNSKSIGVSLPIIKINKLVSSIVLNLKQQPSGTSGFAGENGNGQGVRHTLQSKSRNGPSALTGQWFSEIISSSVKCPRKPTAEGSFGRMPLLRHIYGICANSVFSIGYS